MSEQELCRLLENLVKHSQETEWIEFKLNFHSAEEIGKQISGLANSACIHDLECGYLVFGVEDYTHSIKGTTFRAKSHKQKKEELEHWLIQRLKPKIDFRIFEFEYSEGIYISIFIVPAATNTPIEFLHKSYIRISSITRPLSEFPEKARKIWKNDNNIVFEDQICLENLNADKVVSLLDTQSYFELLDLPYPSTRNSVLAKFESEGLILKLKDLFQITNLGALVFAKDLNDFSSLKRKAVRVIIYKGKNKLEPIREQIGGRGYGVGFTGLIDWVNDQLPVNEVIGKALRKNVKMYPEIALRELIANAIIHQDFEEKGFPTIEIYSDRIEISNSGLPLISPDRFIDEYQSRNEKLADLMRRLGICEEKGSGVDKVINSTEVFQLPAPNFIKQEKHTKSILYAFQEFNQMTKNDKIRATYQHSCLKYVTNEKMTNSSLRERFGIAQRNSAIISRIIKDTLEKGLIKYDDPGSNTRKYAKYVPFWA